MRAHSIKYGSLDHRIMRMRLQGTQQVAPPFMLSSRVQPCDNQSGIAPLVGLAGSLHSLSL